MPEGPEQPAPSAPPPTPGPQPPPPGPPPDAAARRPRGRAQPPATAPLDSSGLAALDARYAAVGLADADVPGDGDCLLYAALGRTAAGMHAAQPTAGDGQAARSLRAAAIAHAPSLPHSLQVTLGLVRPGLLPGDDDGSRGQAYWSLAYQQRDRNPMCDNMLHSIATVLQQDIAVVTTSAEQTVNPILSLWRAGPAAPAAGAAHAQHDPTGLLTWERGAGRRAAHGLQTVRERLDLIRHGALPLRIIHSDGGRHFRTTIPRQRAAAGDAQVLTPAPPSSTCVETARPSCGG